MLDLSRLTMTQAAEAFRAGRFSPLALTQAYLARIEQHDPSLNSFITVTRDEALRAAEATTNELASGTDRGPLQGIPVVLKDLIATAGIRTTSAARITADRVPDTDATVVRSLHRAGAVVLGKVNMLEFAYGVVHPDFGAALNPWNLEYSSGGSSSGSAVAVAAGLGLGALGTDTGGSIRLPAAWCGVVGHKPTYGLVSRSGVDPLSWSLDHVGPMTRTVTDAALLLEATAGYDPSDPGSAPGGRFHAGDLDRVDPRQLRIGVPRELLEEGVDREIRQVVERALEQLAAGGMHVEPMSLGTDRIDDLLAAEMTIMFAEASAVHQTWLRTRPDDYSPLTRDRLEAGVAIPAIHYLNAQRVRRRLIADFQHLHQSFDLLATPGAPTAAMRNDQTMLEINGEPIDVFRGLVRITGLFNVTGAPAVSVPCGWTENRLPVGLQFVGRPFEDHVVLAAARELERVMAAPLQLPTLPSDR
jgi:aspartyl-tRNA(Asn)/glutamyl-tRNA(Gln) amidotransferase subunit A